MVPCSLTSEVPECTEALQMTRFRRAGLEPPGCVRAVHPGEFEAVVAPQTLRDGLGRVDGVVFEVDVARRHGGAAQNSV